MFVDYIVRFELFLSSMVLKVKKLGETKKRVNK